MEKPTILEKISGNPIAQGVLTAIAASAGTPIAALLPVLADTLAAGRHQKRVEAALWEIQTILQAHSEKLTTLTDPQYKLLNEVVLAIFQNTEEQKVEYLRRAVINGISASEINHTISSQVSRSLRDMTAGELAFVTENVGLKVMIGPVSGINQQLVKVINRDSDEMTYVSGLIGLGAITPAGSTIDDIGVYVFADFCHALKELLAG